MFKKVCLVWLTVVVFGLGNIVFNSCNDFFARPESRVCSISLNGIGNTPGNPGPLELPIRYTERMGFTIFAEGENNCELLPQFIKSCRATTICKSWINRIDDYTLQLQLNRKIVIAGDTLAPQINLFENPKFNAGVSITNIPDCKSYWLEILFTPELVQDMWFEEGIYTATVNCRTNDDKNLTANAEVVFRE